MDEHHIDCLVIGAGVVGLAVARELAQRGRDVVIVEARDAIGTGISSRNSEVIHAGLYYPTGTLKARLCVEGKHALYAYAKAHNIPHQVCEKLVVATTPLQEDDLSALALQAKKNGVEDVALLDRRDAEAIEPGVRCHAALLSPSTGIIDSHAFMLSLQGELEDAGGMIAFNTPVQGGCLSDQKLQILTGGAVGAAIHCASIINAGGLNAPTIAGAIGGIDEDRIPRPRFAKGNYFAVNTPVPFARLIYPLPEPGGLGVHLTKDLGGASKAGPDVEWVDQVTYDVDAQRADAFYAAIRAYWPGLPDDCLTPDYASIRPKIELAGNAYPDFLIDGPQEHGIAGLVHLFGIESPGLTASLAIAKYVADQIEETER